MTEMHLSKDQLLSLIRNEGTGDSSCLKHLDVCESCQCRIESLSANPWMWEHGRRIVQSTLVLNDETHVYSGKDSIEKTSDDDWMLPNVKDLLAPPIHPELLGRLDHYDVESIIGRGGAGVVFKGMDTELRRPVAIKILLPHLSGHGASRKRFLREARAAAAIKHPHVVEIYQVKAEASNPYLVMELVPGNSIQEEVDLSGPLAEIEIVQYSLQVAEGLAAAHSHGLIHRDIKPANILLEPGGRRALITDFGLARTIDEASLTCTGLIAGTPHYMSPEQCHGRQTDSSSDLFSLGCLMYFMCCGRPPFRGEGPMAVMNRICTDSPRDIREINPEVSASLARIIHRLIEKSPADRFESASETADLLRQQLAFLQHPRSVAPEVRNSNKPTRKIWRPVAWSLLLLLVIGWGGQSVWTTWSQPSSASSVSNLEEYLSRIQSSKTIKRDLLAKPVSSTLPAQADEAIQNYQELLDQATNELGDGHLVVAEIYERLGMLYQITEKWPEVEHSFSNAGKIQLQHRSADHDSIVCNRLRVILAQFEQGNVAGVTEFLAILQNLDSRASVPGEIKKLVDQMKLQLESAPFVPPRPAHSDEESNQRTQVPQVVAPSFKDTQ